MEERFSFRGSWGGQGSVWGWDAGQIVASRYHGIFVSPTFGEESTADLFALRRASSNSIEDTYLIIWLH